MATPNGKEHSILAQERKLKKEPKAAFAQEVFASERCGLDLWLAS
jgi:hypothetical protein